MRQTIAWVGLLVALGAADVASAQAVDEERARIHFQAGREYFAVGEYEQALQEFERAYANSSRAELLWNIALCEERLGRYAAAADSLERFVQAGGGQEDRAVLAERIRNLRARAAASGPGALTWAAIGSFAGAGIGLALGVTFGVLALDEKSTLDACRPNCAAGADDTMRAFAVVSDVGSGVAIAAATLGVVLLVVDLQSSGERAGLAVSPWAARDGGGATIGGAF